MKLAAMVVSALGLVACVDAPPPPVTVTWTTSGPHPFIADDRISTIVVMRSLETDKHLDGANIPARDGEAVLALDGSVPSDTPLPTEVRICVNLYYSAGGGDDTCPGLETCATVQEWLGVGACDNFTVTDQALETTFTLQMPE